jgi:hypothetical protein
MAAPGGAPATNRGGAWHPGVFDFREDDLRLNRQGYMSQRQRAWLQGTGRGMLRFSRSSATIALGFVLLGGCIILALYLQNEGSRRALFSSPLNLLMLAGALLVALAAIVLSVWLARRSSSALANARLEKVEGLARLDEDYSPGSALTSYHVFIGNHKFSFGEDMSDVFKAGGHYRLYYCKSGPSQIILSFEQLKPA